MAGSCYSGMVSTICRTECISQGADLFEMHQRMGSSANNTYLEMGSQIVWPMLACSAC